jgi:hypothetical protein
MSDKDFVKSIYPKAEAHQTKETKEIGRREAKWPEHWDIFDGQRHHGQQPLGTGTTEAAAWKDAADKIRATQPRQ